MDVILRLGPGFDPVFSYDDVVSPNAHEAAERAWRITNAHPGDLDADEFRLRNEFEQCAPGHSVGFGDIVEIDGRPYTCSFNGFV